MPKVVPVPGVGHVAFPDHVPDHEIQMHIDEHLGKPRPDLIRGMADIPLTSAGIKHIKALSQKLGPFDVIFTNDLRRTQQTAKLLNPKRLIIDTNLRPMHYGAFTGKPSATFAPAMHAMIKQDPGRPLPEGDNFADWTRRLARGIAQVHDYVDQHPNEKVGIVMNRSSMQTYQALLHGSDIDEALKYTPGEKPGSAFRRDGVELVPVQSAEKPGEYVVRHGETFWNGSAEAANAAS